MAARDMEHGAVGEAVADNIRRLRRRRDLSQQQLADRLGELGRPMRASAVMKVESGDRRVDVDDLVAFAVALNVSVPRLLLPDVGEEDEVRLVKEIGVPAWSAWKWASGQHSLLTGAEDLNQVEIQCQELDYAAERPVWLRLREQQPLAQATRRLSFAVDRLLAHRGRTGGGAKSKAGARLLTNAVDQALDQVRREVDQLGTEEASRG